MERRRRSTQDTNGESDCCLERSADGCPIGYRRRNVFGITLILSCYVRQITKRITIKIMCYYCMIFNEVRIICVFDLTTVKRKQIII